MYLKSLLARPLANYVFNKTKKWMETAVSDQEKLMKLLVKTAKQTEFGKDHAFDKIETYDDFKQRIPVRDYEQLKPYIEKIKERLYSPGGTAACTATNGTNVRRIGKVNDFSLVGSVN